jgi:anthranilate phosphoribosyltransferase
LEFQRYKGEPVLAYDCLLYNVAIILCRRKCFDTFPAAADAVNTVLKSGMVLERLRAIGANV